jgi:fumarylacetoacetate (FAA) hydrolase
VKLCRFELLAAPDQVRSGIVYGGKVYETDGSNAIAVHEADQIRPLPPIGQPPSVRFFRPLEREQDLDPEAAIPFFYGNPSILIGASQIVPYPPATHDLDFEAFVAAVVGQTAFGVSADEADALVIGYTIVIALVARDLEREERTWGIGPARSHDLAMAVGPVLTTPDDIEAAVEDESSGKRYRLSAVARVNGVEVGRGDVADLPFTPAAAISTASRSCLLQPGDLFLLGPIAPSDGGRDSALDPGDEIQVAVEHLGTLSVKIGT